MHLKTLLIHSERYESNNLSDEWKSHVSVEIPKSK